MNSSVPPIQHLLRSPPPLRALFSLICRFVLPLGLSIALLSGVNSRTAPSALVQSCWRSLSADSHTRRAVSSSSSRRLSFLGWPLLPTSSVLCVCAAVSLADLLCACLHRLVSSAVSSACAFPAALVCSGAVFSSRYAVHVFAQIAPFSRCASSTFRPRSLVHALMHFCCHWQRAGNATFRVRTLPSRVQLSSRSLHLLLHYSWVVQTLPSASERGMHGESTLNRLSRFCEQLCLLRPFAQGLWSKRLCTCAVTTSNVLACNLPRDFNHACNFVQQAVCICCRTAWFSQPSNVQWRTRNARRVNAPPALVLLSSSCVCDLPTHIQDACNIRTHNP